MTLLLTANDASDFSWYVQGHDEDDLNAIDEPDLLLWERVWMCPVRASALDESDRPPDCETLTRDAQGRFAATVVWLECDPAHPGAEPFLGAKYKPPSGEEQP